MSYERLDNLMWLDQTKISSLEEKIYCILNLLVAAEYLYLTVKTQAILAHIIKAVTEDMTIAARRLLLDRFLILLETLTHRGFSKLPSLPLFLAG